MLKCRNFLVDVLLFDKPKHSLERKTSQPNDIYCYIIQGGEAMSVRCAASYGGGRRVAPAVSVDGGSQSCSCC